MLRQLLASGVIRHAGRSVMGSSSRHISCTPAMLQTFKNYTPNNLEKRFLVWSGKYKTVEDVPSHISQEEMERVRNRYRIRLANIMIVLTAIGCCIMVYSGKQAAKRGDSVTKMNLDWHAKYNESQNRAAAVETTASPPAK